MKQTSLFPHQKDSVVYPVANAFAVAEGINVVVVVVVVVAAAAVGFVAAAAKVVALVVAVAVVVGVVAVVDGGGGGEINAVAVATEIAAVAAAEQLEAGDYYAVGQVGVRILHSVVLEIQVSCFPELKTVQQK